ncbi:hypothetical protein HJ590_12145 [Naumannella sp. ID2617S]|nr:hypothetical protein [Naumannella sp. ID2617S]
MRLNQHQQQQLRRVAAAAEQAEAAEQQRRDSIRAAHAAGVPVLTLATVLGVTRGTVDRIIKPRPGDRPRRHPDPDADA